MKLLVCSDVHLDTQFRWAGPELARRRRSALRETFTRIAELAASERVDAWLIAGDLYENDRFEADTPAFVRDRLLSSGVPVFIAPGNHDWYGPGSLYRQLEADLPPRVHVFSTDRLAPVELTAGFTLWGAAHLAPAGTSGFLTNFAVHRDGLNVALFHGSEIGELAFQGADKAPHAPFRASEVAASGLAHAFAGHYHSPKDGQWHTYPGNPDPLTFGETGLRGVVVAEFDSAGTLTRRRENVATSSVHDLDVDLTGVEFREQARERVAAAVAGLTGVVRARLAGELARDLPLGPADLEGVGQHLDALLPVFGRLSRAYDFEALRTENTVRGRFVAEVLAADLDEEFRRAVLLTGLRAFSGRGDELDLTRESEHAD